MTKTEILSLFSDDVEVRKQRIKEFIMDGSNSYEDRKEVWETTPEHLRTIEDWVITLDNFEEKYGEISWYDDFYCERGALVRLSEILSFVEDDWDEEKMKDFITECMDMGCHGFVNDW